MNEIKQIESFPDYYVSDDGMVFSNKTNHLKPLKLSTDHDGYKTVGLYNNGFHKRIKVHRLVANAFLEKDPNRSCINHKDGNKANNNYMNLEWCTPKENSTHAYKNGLLQYGNPQRIGTRKKARFSDNDVQKIKELYDSGMSQRTIGHLMGCDHSVVSEIVTGKIYKPIMEKNE